MSNQTSIEQIEILQDEWIGCYRGGWKGVIVDEAFSHPAKVAFTLAKRIYEHAIDGGWIVRGDTVVDPFGGIGGCAFHGLMNGMIVVTNELEEKFVNLSKQNRELWREKFTGLPGFNADNWIILQGDSRNLASVIREAGCCVSSPPYIDSVNPEKHGIDWDKLKKDYPGRVMHDGRKEMMDGHHAERRYGESEGQLGAMKEGDLSLVVSSPPYASGEKGHPSLGSVNKDDWGNDGRDITRRRGLTGEYGAADGNVANMPEGDHAICVSSPPFPQPYTGGGGINVKGYGDGSDKVGDRTYQSQGGDRAEGNLETLANEGFQAAISSPPYEGSLKPETEEQTARKQLRIAQSKSIYDGRALEESSPGKAAIGGGYGTTEGNTGAMETDTFWSASRVILEQLYAVLSPGAHAIFITKRFVRDKQIVEFTDQWIMLAEAVGFRLLHQHKAMLTENYGAQHTLTGEVEEKITERKSFFRRLAEKKGSPRIDWEDVTCFVKPA